jgi:flagellar basal-body rod protein FlgF
MIYGLYLSASGVLANSVRQDVIANNLANSETIGFKRDLAMFRQRLTAAQELGLNPATDSNQMLEALGGGIMVAGGGIDTAQGELEPTGNALDLAIQGEGYFAVRQQGKTYLTRNGNFMADRAGRLITNSGQEVLDEKQKPIVLSSTLPAQVAADGTVSQGGQAVAKIGLFGPPAGAQLAKRGRTLLEATGGGALRPADGTIRSEFLERSNVDPATELTALMDAQRQLEANANMIRFQDQTLSRLVNDVGKIG